MITYKARLVAKGYRHRQGIDYDKTFSPIAMLKSIRILLAFVAHYDYEICQMNVKTTFLNGNLSEQKYMTQLEGFIFENGSKGYKLQRSIYGLKQHLGVGISDLMRQLKSLVSQKIRMSLVCTRRQVGG